MERLVSKLKGPVAVLGAKGFIGSHLVRMLREHREDVYEGTHDNLWPMLDEVKPQTVFNCIVYGTQRGHNSAIKAYHTNFVLTECVLGTLSLNGFDTYIHAGSCSEYGTNAAGPSEDNACCPNTPYGVSKLASSILIEYYGKVLNKRVANLRIYTAYGPGEPGDRLIPTLIREGLEGRLPEFVAADTTRDFVYVEDVCRAFVYAAVNLKPKNYGESFNVGTGMTTAVGHVAETARRLFGITEEPKFTRQKSETEISGSWYADPSKARYYLGFRTLVGFEAGFRKTIEAYKKC